MIVRIFLLQCLVVASLVFTQATGFVASPSVLHNRKQTVLYSNSPTPEEEPDPELVTKEDFMREMLRDPEVIVKKKKSKKTKHSKPYKVLDNRDLLPFSVNLQTPDPYKHPDLKRKEAKKHKRPKDTIEDHVSSRLYRSESNQKDTDNSKTLLGDFSLDKHTTTGDRLIIDNIEYKVLRHRCQYKYAGGQQFVMIRKILEVKEVERLSVERNLKRVFQSDPPTDLPAEEE